MLTLQRVVKFSEFAVPRFSAALTSPPSDFVLPSARERFHFSYFAPAQESRSPSKCQITVVKMVTITSTSLRRLRLGFH